jgi:hypothetical protein
MTWISCRYVEFRKFEMHLECVWMREYCIYIYM